MGVSTAGRLSADRPPVLKLGEILAVQNARWDDRDPMTIGRLVAEHPELADDPTRLIPPVFNEWMLRWGGG